MDVDSLTEDIYATTFNSEIQPCQTNNTQGEDLLLKESHDISTAKVHSKFIAKN